MYFYEKDDQLRRVTQGELKIQGIRTEDGDNFMLNNLLLSPHFLGIAASLSCRIFNGLLKSPSVTNFPSRYTFPYIQNPTCLRNDSCQRGFRFENPSRRVMAALRIRLSVFQKSPPFRLPRRGKTSVYVSDNIGQFCCFKIQSGEVQPVNQPIFEKDRQVLRYNSAECCNQSSSVKVK